MKSDNLIHSTAIVSSKAKIGESVRIDQFNTIDARIEITERYYEIDNLSDKKSFL